MAVTVSYDQDCKMTISGVDCACGCQHRAIDKDIYIGKGLLPRIPSYIARRGLGTHCVLVADDNTYRVAGAEVEKALLCAGFSVVSCVIHREHDMLPDDLSCGESSVHLSGKEFEVMSVLMSSSARVVSKQDLLLKVWGADAEASENSVEAYVSFLRKKLAHVGSAVQITTLRMLGYRLETFER